MKRLITLIVSIAFVLTTGCGSSVTDVDKHESNSNRASEGGNVDTSIESENSQDYGESVDLGSTYNGINIRPDVANAIKNSALLGGDTVYKIGDSLICFGDDHKVTIGNKLITHLDGLKYAQEYYDDQLTGICSDYFSFADGKVVHGLNDISNGVKSSLYTYDYTATGTEELVLISDSGNLLSSIRGGNLENITSDKLTSMYSALGKDIVFQKDGGIQDIVTGNSLGSYMKKEMYSEIDGVANIVVGTGYVKNDFDLGFIGTVAGITADGSLYAIGREADEIKGWGDLSYIIVDSGYYPESGDCSLVVGLKTDGTLIFSSSSYWWYSMYYDTFVKPELTGKIIGIALTNKCLNIMTEDNTLYSLRYYDDTVLKFTEEECTSSNPNYELNDLYKVDSSGNVFAFENGKFVS